MLLSERQHFSTIQCNRCCGSSVAPLGLINHNLSDSPTAHAVGYRSFAATAAMTLLGVARWIKTARDPGRPVPQSKAPGSFTRSVPGFGTSIANEASVHVLGLTRRREDTEDTKE